MGASETASYGLPVRALGFPELVASQCGIRSIVDAVSGIPVLRRLPRPYPNVNANVVFVSPFDAALRPDIGATDRWLRDLSTKPTLILESPPAEQVHISNPLISREQRELYGYIREAAQRDRIDEHAFYRLANDSGLLQADGVHPSERGNKVIASFVVSWLRIRHLCPRSD